MPERLPQSPEERQQEPHHVRDELLNLAAATGAAVFLVSLMDFSFADWIKDLVWARQNGHCADCNKPIAEYHHIVPEKALRNQGIRGKDVPDNAVGLCFNHHKNRWDQKMFHGVFYPGVTLDQLDPNTYSQYTPKNKHKRRR